MLLCFLNFSLFIGSYFLVCAAETNLDYFMHDFAGLADYFGGYLKQPSLSIIFFSLEGL